MGGADAGLGVFLPDSEADFLAFAIDPLPYSPVCRMVVPSCVDQPCLFPQVARRAHASVQHAHLVSARTHAGPASWLYIAIMNALELSQVAANYATVANLGAAIATMVIAVLTYLASFGGSQKRAQLTH